MKQKPTSISLETSIINIKRIVVFSTIVEDFQKIIKFLVNSMQKIKNSYTFYNYYYAIEFVKIVKNADIEQLYFNIEYLITLINYS